MGAWTWCGKNFGELRDRDFGFGGQLAYVGDTEKEKKTGTEDFKKFCSALIKETSEKILVAFNYISLFICLLVCFIIVSLNVTPH